jgi:hypothetical protein
MSRLFLLLLLAVDWAASPEQLAPAVALLAKPMASTECYCDSLTPRPGAEGHLPQTLALPLSLSPVPALLAVAPSRLWPDQGATSPPRASLQMLFCTWQI